MRRRRLRFLLLLALLAASIALLVLPFTSRSLVEARLSELFGRPVAVGEVRLWVLPFKAEILDLRVAGAAPDAPPFLQARRVEVVPSLATLLTPRLTLARVRVEGLTLRVNATPDGGDDIPRPHGSNAGGVEVRVRRLTIDSGEVILNHARIPMNLDLPDFKGRLAARHGGALAGSLSFGPGPIRFGDAPPLSASTEMEVVLQGATLSVEKAHARTEHADLAYQGEIRLQDGAPMGALTIAGPFDLDELDSHVLRTGLSLAGQAHFQGSIAISGSRVKIQGQVNGTGGRFQGVAVPQFSAQVLRDEQGVHVKHLEASLLGGSALLDVDVPALAGLASLEARLQAVDAEGAVAALFQLAPAGLGAAATGDVSLRWPRGAIRRLSGTIALDVAPRGDGRTPVEGRFQWSAKDGAQQVERASFKTPHTWGGLVGQIGADGRVDLGVDAESGDLGETDVLLQRLRKSLGSRSAEPFGVTGSGSFRGRCTGRFASPVFSGRFSGREVGYLGVDWGRAEWAGSVEPDAILSHSLVLRRESAELWLDGSLQTSAAEGVDARVRLVRWPAMDFETAFGWAWGLSGAVSGEATLGGTRSLPVGDVRITAEKGRYRGIGYEAAEVTARLKGDVTEIVSGRVRVGGGEIHFEGTASAAGEYDGKARAEAVEIAGLGTLPPLLAGRISGELALSGRLERPTLKASLSAQRLFFGDEGLGAFAAEIAGAGDGSLTLRSTLRSARVDAEVAGDAELAEPYQGQLAIQVRKTSLDPFLRTLSKTLPPSIGVVVSGQATLSGPLLSPAALRADASLDSFEVLLPDYPVRNAEPLRLLAAEGRLNLQAVHLGGEGTDLVVDGFVPLQASGAVGLGVRGAADLRTLSAVTRRLRGRGAARLALTVTGTGALPRAEGVLDLDGAGIRVRGVPQGLEDVRGRVEFTETAAHFEGVKGSLGGGSVEMDGQAAYAEGRLGSFDVHSLGRGIALRYPEGLRSTVDADLRLFGDAAQQWVTGGVDVRQALWTRRYDVATELLAAGRLWEPQASLGGALRYDVKIRAPGTLKIDNNLATLQARADLTLSGTFDSPVVLGRAEVDRGRVYFQGNTYVIRRGSIDFADPEKIDPLFDIEGETRIRSYRVVLKVNGTLQRVYPTLTSDPPLSAVQILNLLAGGDESAVGSLQATSSDQARLAATGAATLAAGRLSEQVGLERGAERLFGLNRFSIDPSVVKGGVTNPTARLTVGKRLTPDLTVLYSTDLRGSEDRLLSVEYTLSDRLSLLLTAETNGGLGFDIRRRQSR